MNRGRNRKAGAYSTPRGGRGGRSWRPIGDSASSDHHTPIGADMSSTEFGPGTQDKRSHSRGQTSSQGPGGDIRNHYDSASASGFRGGPTHGFNRYAYTGISERWKVSSNTGGSGWKQSECSSDIPHKQQFSSSFAEPDLRDKGLVSRKTQAEKNPTDSEIDGSSLNLDQSLMESIDSNDFVALDSHSFRNDPRSIQASPKHEQTEPPKHLAVGDHFDICPPKTGDLVMLKPSLLMKNREKRSEMRRAIEGLKGTALRPGMVLLKNHISIPEQVKIINICQKLGCAPGGFYQPGYRDGAKLHLKMMCLGKNWDPETSQYGDLRPSDGSKPPAIPTEFHQLVRRAIKDSHALIEEEAGRRNVEIVLPWMSPDICLVNFYATGGRLGLHQDKDESQETLLKGLPVVSFSIGDSAEFLYGDQRDIEKAEKVVLQSGDVLIFGGQSRHIFHGVTAIIPDTAPKSLLEETNLRPGRLNLTFRQY